MKTQKQDRRIQKTRSALKTALLQLMLEKNIQEISIVELSERANTNRGTFYLHYPDVFSLLEEIENEYIHDVSRVFQDVKEQHGNLFKQRAFIMIRLLEFCYENQNTTTILLMDRGRILFHTKFKEVLWQNLSESLKEVNNSEDEFLRYYTFYIISGIIGIIQEWARNGFNITPETLATNMQNLMTRNRFDPQSHAH